MAKAPAPGTAGGTRLGFEITLGDESWRIMGADIGGATALKVRQKTGGPLRVHLDADTLDLDSICILIWVAEVHQGLKVTLEEVFDRYPTYDSIADIVLEEILDEKALAAAKANGEGGKGDPDEGLDYGELVESEPDPNG